MDYYTRFELEVDQDSDKVEEYLAIHGEGYCYGRGFMVNLLTDAGWNDKVKWHEHDNEMIYLSKEFPHVLFTLTGHGEEEGDIWKKYYKNGQVQLAEAKITFDPPTL